jgi:hypothetical protein
VILCKKYVYYHFNYDDFYRIGVETTTGCLLAANRLGKRGKSSSDVGIEATE